MSKEDFSHFHFHAPMHEVAPRAVRIAVAMEAMICTIHFTVSFFVIMVNV